MSSHLLCKLVLEEMQFGPIRRPPIVGRKDGGLKLRLGGRREEGEEGKGGEGGRRKVMEYFKIDRRGGRRTDEVVGRIVFLRRRHPKHLISSANGWTDGMWI